MITLEQAKRLCRGDILHHDIHKNHDGTCQRWRVNGKVKVWKRDPGKVRVPLKHGLWDHDTLREIDLDLVHLPEECTRK